MNSKFKQLGKDSFVYGIGGVVAKGISVIFLPIYTRIFSPELFGQITMLALVNSFLLAFMTMGMDSALTFFFNEQKENGILSQKKVVSSILKLEIVFGLILVIIAILLAPILNKLFFNNSLTKYLFIISFVGCFFQILFGLTSSIFRLLFKPWKYLFLNLSNSLLTSFITIVLIVKYNYGIKGFFIGITLSAIISALVGLISIRTYMTWDSNLKSWYPKLMQFGIPLIPASIAMYILNTSDRWFLNHYHNMSTVGLYAVGAKIVMFITLITITFRQAFWPHAMSELQNKNGQLFFRAISKYYIGFFSICVILLTGISPLLISFLMTDSYYESYKIVGILSWQAIFYGFYLIAGIGIWKEKKTYITTILIFVAAILNIIFNYYLVPHYGIIGASIGTSASFFIWIVMTMVISEKLWYVGFPYFTLAAQLGIGVFASTAILAIDTTKEGYIKTISIVLVSVLLIGWITNKKYIVNKYFKLFRI